MTLARAGAARQIAGRARVDAPRMLRLACLVTSASLAAIACGGSASVITSAPEHATTTPLPDGFHEIDLKIEGRADFPAVQRAIRRALPGIALRMEEARQIDPTRGGDLVIELVARPGESRATAQLRGGSLADVPAAYWAIQHAGGFELPVHQSGYTARYTVAIDPRGAETPLTAADRERLRSSDLDLIARDGAPAATTVTGALLPALERCMLAEDTERVWVVARVTDGKVAIVPTGRETYNPGRDARHCVSSKLARLAPQDLGETAFISFAAARHARDTRPSGLPAGATTTPPRTEPSTAMGLPSSATDATRRVAVAGVPLARVDARALEAALSAARIPVRVPGDAHDPDEAVVFALAGDRVAVVRRVPTPKLGPCAIADGPDAIDVAIGPAACGSFLEALRAPPPKQDAFDR